MAVLGEANIIVRAITTGVEDDIKRAFGDIGKGSNNPGSQAGDRIGKAFKKSNAKEAINASKMWTRLMRVSMVLQGAIGTLVGSLASLGSGLFSIAGAFGQAAASGVVLVSTFASIKVASMVVKSAMKGIGQAVKAAEQDQSGLTKTLKEAREEMQQLAFDAEDAALGEKRAALTLEQAREELMRVQDLPPNTRARREAELAYAEADLNMRRAIDRNKDLQDEMANGGKKDKKAGKDPYADLTASQKVFAKYLVGIQGQLKSLREQAASGFLPLLQTQIDRFLKGGAFDVISKGYQKIGVGMGVATKNLADAILTPGNLTTLRKFLDGVASNMPQLGKVLGNVFSIFLNVMRAAQPLTDRFLKWLVKATDNLNTMTKVGANSGVLAKFFKRSGDAAAQIGRIFKNVFGGLGAMFKSATGPGSGGQLLLDWMERASTKFRETKQSFSGSLIDEKNLRGSAGNFKEIFQTLNDILGAFKGLGADPAVGGFWQAIRSAVPQIKLLLRNSVKTAASFGKLAAAVLKMMSLFSDSGQATAFFDILSNSVSGLYEILKHVSWFFDGAGPILGALSAFGLLGLAFVKLQLIMKGFAIRLALLLVNLKFIPGAAKLGGISLKAMGTSAKLAGAAMKTAFLSNPVFLAFMIAAELIMWAFNAAAEAAQKEVDQVNAAFESGATAAEAWNNALSGRGEATEAALSFDKLGTAMSALALWDDKSITWDETYEGLDKLGVKSEEFRDQVQPLKDELSAFGKALGEMAAEDLEGAQKNFSGLAHAQGMTRAGQKKMLAEMPEYRDELLKQAEALGINIKNADGTVNSNKQLAFALGEGEIALRRAAAAATEFNKKIAGAAAEMVDLNAAVEANTAKNGKVNTKGLVSTLKQQANDAAKYYSNLLKLQGKVGAGAGGQALIENIIGMGAKAGSALTESLVNGSQADIDALVSTYSQVGVMTGDEMAASLQEAGPAINLAFAKLGDAGGNAFVNSVLAGKNVGSLTTNLLTKLNAKGNGVTYKKNATSGRIEAWLGTTKIGTWAKGGLIRPMRLAGGSTAPIAGFGGPQSDGIPIMASPGEFMMNASATSRFLPTLQAMNQTSVTGNRLNSTVPAAQAVAGTSGSVSIVVNPSPGMNEADLAKRVAIEMARQMRKGV